MDASPAEARLRGVPWRALAPSGRALHAPLAEILAGAPAERVVDRFLRSRRDLAAAGRAAASEALFGVGLWRRRLAAQLGVQDPRDAAAGLLLAALLRDLAGLPPGEAEALAGVAPGALPPPRPAPGDLARRHSLPDWLAEELARAVGPAAGALADALNRPGPLFLRVNSARCDRAALAARLAAEGVATRPGRWSETCLEATSPRPNVLGLPAFREGLLEVQDEGSQLAGAIAAAREGEEVLDLCAGAGGKALLLAAAVGAAGRVHACDADAARLARLAARARRAGAANVVVHGAAPPAGLEVDVALVDAPCSELGPLRRGPDLRFRLDPASFAALPALQLDLLRRAARAVRAGGRLAYVTCTFRREENEDVAAAFEALHPGFARIRPAAPAPTVGEDLLFRALPHVHGTDGFFGAVWRAL
jgi:16S rRNA (cytosine967-C5)-methyltransferase